MEVFSRFILSQDIVSSYEDQKNEIIVPKVDC